MPEERETLAYLHILVSQAICNDELHSVNVFSGDIRDSRIWVLRDVLSTVKDKLEELLK